MYEFSIIYCSCLIKKHREEYLRKSIKSIRNVFPDKEILIAFDKEGTEIDGTICYTHNKGMGHSFNWGIKESSNDFILQLEDDWDLLYDPKNNPDDKSFIDQFCHHLNVIEKHGGIYRLVNMDNGWWESGSIELFEYGMHFKELNRPLTGTDPDRSLQGYFYANHPHFKKKDFHDKIGYYLEESPPDRVEIDMCKKYLNSEERVFFSPFNTFYHIGYESARER
jgi:glycosyltransferase involved in cell wall biosynthesis